MSTEKFMAGCTMGLLTIAFCVACWVWLWTTYGWQLAVGVWCAFAVAKFLSFITKLLLEIK